MFLYCDMPILNTNIKTFNSFTESPKSHSFFFIALIQRAVELAKGDKYKPNPRKLKVGRRKVSRHKTSQGSVSRHKTLVGCADPHRHLGPFLLMQI